MQLVAQETDAMCTQSSSNSILGFIDVKRCSLKAEIIWSMKVIYSNYSAASCQHIGALFQSIIPCDISKHFNLSPA